MFASFKSLKHKEEKRKALLAENELELQNDQKQRRAYSEAIWSSDPKFDMSSGSNKMTTTTQTDQDTSTRTTHSTSIMTNPSIFHEDDIGNEDDSMSDIDDNQPMSDREIDVDDLMPNAPTFDEEETKEGDVSDESMHGESKELMSKRILIDYYNASPILVSRRYNLISKMGNTIGTWILGPSAVVLTASGRIAKNTDRIDMRVSWALTKSFIETKELLLQKSQKSVFSAIRNNKDRTRSTVSAETIISNEIKQNLIQLIENNPDLNKIKALLPMTQEGFELSGYKIDPASMLLKTKQGKAAKKQLRDSISWPHVVDTLKRKAYINKLDLDVSGTTFKMDKPAKRNRENSYISDDQRQTKSGDIIEIDQIASNYRGIIYTIYKNNPWLIDTGISPTMRSDVSTEHDRYIFGPYGSLVYRSDPTKSIESKNIDMVNRSISWEESFDTVLVEMDKRYEALSANPANERNVAIKDSIRKTFTGLKLLSSKPELSLESNDRLSNFVKIQMGLIKDTNTRREQANDMINTLGEEEKIDDAFSTPVRPPRRQVPRIYISPTADSAKSTRKTGKGLSTNSKIIGRGLIGGARTCLNLKSIEGTGSASDLNYKRLGSKFIRLKDLHQNKLKLVFPNRSSVGRIRAISPNLSKVIATLLHDKEINDEIYSELDIEEKRLFHEILKSTHLQHRFREVLVDPRDALRSEFDKLRGELMLGNDNPDMLRELKLATIEMFSQKMISVNDFNQIIAAII